MAWMGALCALLAAGCAILAQAPYDLSFLAFVALVPFAALSQRARADSPYRAAYLGGLIHFGIGCAWLRHTHPANLGLMTLIEGLTFPLALLVLRRLRQAGAPLSLALPLAWVAVEWGRSYWPFNGFPWLLLGNALAHPLEWAQNSDLCGPLGLSFFAALTSGCLASAVLPAQVVDDSGATRALSRSGRSRLAFVLLAFAIPAALWQRGASALDSHPLATSTAGGPVLALIQANIPQDLKQATKKSPSTSKSARENEAVAEARDIMRRHVKLTEQAVAAGPVDLVVWPETMIPGWFMHTAADPKEQAYLESYLFAPTLRPARTQIVLGVLTCDAERLFATDTYNTALFYGADGQRRGRYSKTVLVPGGEFVPLRSWLGFIIDPIVLSIAPVIPSLTPGAGPSALLLSDTATGAPDTHFGVTICYENVYAKYHRQVAKLGVDFVLNLSNEGWFKDSAEFDQMNAASVLRAIETRRPLVRATNTGISAIYDWAGRQTHAIRTDAGTAGGGRDRELEGVLRIQVPRQQGDSFFLAYGEIPITVLASLTWLVFFVERRLRRYRLAKAA